MIHLIILIVLILLGTFLPVGDAKIYCIIGSIIVGIIGLIRISSWVNREARLSSYVYCAKCGQRIGTVRDHPNECPRCGSNRISRQDPFQ